jgi:hypothetical protein
MAKIKERPLVTAAFFAVLPDIQSAIKVGSDGMRIQFDVPETEKAKAIPLISLNHRILEITVRELSQNEVRALSLIGTKQDYGHSKAETKETEKKAKGTGASVGRRRSKLHGDQ